MPPVPPTDDELNTMIRARLASIGIDLDQLPASTDPVTGTPALDSVLSSLRNFMRSTVPTIAGYQLPAPEGTDPAAAAELSQQGPAPVLYPSILTAWTES
jgi:hypothetical protein